MSSSWARLPRALSCVRTLFVYFLHCVVCCTLTNERSKKKGSSSQGCWPPRKLPPDR